MPKMKIRFSEVATYEVVIETKASPEDIESEAHNWFLELDQQDPDWLKTGLLEVNDRTVESAKRLA